MPFAKLMPNAYQLVPKITIFDRQKNRNQCAE